MAVRRGYADTPRGQIHYAETGGAHLRANGRGADDPAVAHASAADAPPLLLFSATPRTHRCYLRLMALLAPHLRAIAVDMPGFGNSHGLPDPVTMPALADCMADFMDALGIAQADVFGLHTGNKLAAALAVNHAARVRRLILAGQSHSIIPEMAARNAAIEPWFAKYKTHFEPDAQGAHLVREWLGAQVQAGAIWWPPGLVNGRTVQASDVANAEARLIDYVQGWRACVPVYEAVFAYDLEDAYRRIVQPTLVLELLTAQEAAIGGQAARVGALIAGSRIASLRDADGLALEMRPEAFARPLLDFLVQEQA
jgi:pimeloyl-ACP methyl ester carboxylesterase